MKKSNVYTIVLILVTLIAIFGVDFYFLTKPAVLEQEGRVYEVKAGMSKTAVLQDLYQQGIIQHPIFLATYIYPQYKAHLKIGEYRFPQGASALSIWRQLSTGQGQVYYQFTIIPGWSFQQLKQHLSQAKALKHLTLTWDDTKIMTYLGRANLSPEGQFFPETYNYTKNVADLVILKRAYDLMQKRLQEAWQNKAADLPYDSAYQALIAASLIEKEAYLSAERPLIGGVLVNRLRKNMLLQIDPTVIYGMGADYAGKIHKEDLARDTPYNTYVHKGLPPTPIAMPSMASIQAAVRPAQHDYYYFVAKGDGSHQFSQSLPEHNAAVQASIQHKQTSFFNESRIKQYMEQMYAG